MKISTKVESDYLTVKNGFDQKLFLTLNPPFPPVRLLRFDGCQKDDVVALELNFLLFKQVWESVITNDWTNEQEYVFIDKGVKLPFFLSFWEHKHQILSKGSDAFIVDDIQFKTPFLLLDWLMYPLLYGQFLYRVPIYKKYFK